MKEGVLPWLIVFGLVCIGIKTAIDIFEENPVPPLKLGLFDRDNMDVDEEILWERASDGFSIMMDNTNQEKIIVKIQDGDAVVQLSDITRIKKYDKDAYIYKIDERQPILAKRIGLNTLEGKLGTQKTNFFRTKSDLINLKYVRSVKSKNISEQGKNYQFTIYLDDDNKVPLSHEKKVSFMAKLKQVNGILDN